jgi:diguanylate cyclase (GGDEF)-like protein
MLKIGDFANMNNVTVRALRHYEEIGLLKPASIDDFTGYRYYAEGQSAEIKVINILKELGFSLAEIGELQKRGFAKDSLIGVMNRKYTQARIDIDRAMARSAGLQKIIEWIRTLPENEKISIRGIGNMEMEDVMGMAAEETHMEKFDEVLAKAGEEGKNIFCLAMDIDGFKAVNDKYGFKAGDAVLDAIARLAIEKLPGGEGLLWCNKSMLERRGGDEYIMTIDCDQDEALLTAEAIRKNIAGEDFGYLGIDEKLTVSIGVANLESHPSNAGELVHLAETALYLAKHKGRNRVEMYKKEQE